MMHYARPQVADRPIATIVFSDDGLSIPRISPGRSRKPIGRMWCIKAGCRHMAWESKRAEKPMLTLCEVAPPVLSLLSQPHELRMNVTGSSKPLVYFPDLRIVVDRSFADELQSGKGFVDAVRSWRPTPGPMSLVTIIIEVKDDDDPRRGNADYSHKLNLAREVYRRVGWRFHEVVRSTDIEDASLKTSIRSLFIDRREAVTKDDAARATTLLRANGGSTSLGRIVHVLGDGDKGWKRAAALHARRALAIDLVPSITPTTVVREIGDSHVHL